MSQKTGNAVFGTINKNKENMSVLVTALVL